MDGWEKEMIIYAKMQSGKILIYVLVPSFVFFCFVLTKKRNEIFLVAMHVPWVIYTCSHIGVIVQYTMCIIKCTQHRNGKLFYIIKVILKCAGNALGNCYFKSYSMGFNRLITRRRMLFVG